MERRIATTVVENIPQTARCALAFRRWLRGIGEKLSSKVGKDIREKDELGAANGSHLKSLAKGSRDAYGQLLVHEPRMVVPAGLATVKVDDRVRAESSREILAPFGIWFRSVFIRESPSAVFNSQNVFQMPVIVFI